MKIFVYGTLKRGLYNDYLLEGSRFLGVDSVREHGLFTMGIPIVKPRKGAVVHGEVYIVDDETTRTLDRLEGHPRWYRREIVNSEKNGPVWIYLYLHPELDFYFIESGDYMNTLRMETSL